MNNNNILAQRLPPEIPAPQYLVIDEENPELMYAAYDYTFRTSLHNFITFTATHEIKDHRYPVGFLATPFVVTKQMTLEYFTVMKLDTTAEEYAAALTKEKYPML